MFLINNIFMLLFLLNGIIYADWMAITGKNITSSLSPVELKAIKIEPINLKNNTNQDKMSNTKKDLEQTLYLKNEENDPRYSFPTYKIVTFTKIINWYENGFPKIEYTNVIQYTYNYKHIKIIEEQLPRLGGTLYYYAIQADKIYWKANPQRSTVIVPNHHYTPK